MNYLYFLIAVVASVFIIWIIENNKNKRIDKLKDISNSKINSIGKYEKNSKAKNSSIFNFWSKLNDK